MIFAFLDAWNIGANDVANSFATSVSSRSITLKQAMCIATVMEFAGAVGVGIIGAVIGVGIATLGTDGVNWGWNGVAQIFATWGIAPGIAGCFASIIFMITKYGVLKRKNPLRAAFIMVPFYFALTSGILTMLIVWKGAASAASAVKKWGPGEYIGVIFGVAFGVALLSVLFLLPYLHRTLHMGDWQLKWHDMFKGPLLLRRGEVPPNPDASATTVRDYYAGHKTREELERDGRSNPHLANDIEADNHNTNEKITFGSSSGRTSNEVVIPGTTVPRKWYEPEVGKWYEPKNLPRVLYKAFFHGVEVDVVAEQKKSSVLCGNLEEMHAKATHYDNKAEHAYSYLQVLTAATASFAHGANDWIYMGWFITLPVTGIISGCLMGIIINAPQWGNAL
ncbi:putative Phosphate-repressible phosphate permease [Glarea lozoyensis 74030]|uniref:Phosphate transporter n=1 Tax=Glarea lozoyensis (strain ATCC 74030 / MF5533) TaxID=1104152 RepID=H0EUX8_GLAL7|nr:putative Phosphate-repressible phosphate permease [Glarea lozoyensis 74030]